MQQTSFIRIRTNFIPNVALMTINIFFFHLFLNFEDSEEQNELESQFQ